jgi:hypothetical protein
MAYGLIEHSGEHYGQLVVYYRLAGLDSTTTAFYVFSNIESLITFLTMRGVLDDYFGRTREYWGGTVEQLT